MSDTARPPSSRPPQPIRRFPFPAYPNGWFGLAYGDSIACGELTTVRAFGRDLVLWRDDDGAPHVFDAHCPHLGAHLGFGGCVVDGAVRCPFHHWRFDAEGRCIEIPYAKRIPARARIRSWPVCERNELVFAWHHAEGKPPDIEIEPIPEFDDPAWAAPVRKRWSVRSRMYDMGENPVDAQHFRYLHGGIAPSFEQVPDGRGGTRNVSHLEMPTPRGAIEGSITSEYFGPGFGVVHVRGVLHTVIVMSNTPIDDETVDVKFAYLQPATRDPRQARLGEKMVTELVRQMEQDIVIFEHKKYLTKPCLVPEDGPIAEYRRKARRDYTGEFPDPD
jgi:phenylpropionate dioxygenase-like ring-hydroxylating dioxygenase large terminal subunit